MKLLLAARLALAARAAPGPRYAYATLLSGSDAYLPGAETLVCSLALAARSAERTYAAWPSAGQRPWSFAGARRVPIQSPRRVFLDTGVGRPDFLALVTTDVDRTKAEASLTAAGAASGFPGAVVVKTVPSLRGDKFLGKEAGSLTG